MNESLSNSGSSRANYQRTQLPTFKGICMGIGVDEAGNATHAEGCVGYFLTYEFERKRKTRSVQCQEAVNRKTKGANTRSKVQKRLEKQKASIAQAKEMLASDLQLTQADREVLQRKMEEMEKDMADTERQLGVGK